MFGNDTSQLSSGYVNKNNSGTSFLRNAVRSKVYSGDTLIEEKLTKSQLYWKYYNNQHWAKNNDELLSFNYVRAIIDKVNNFLIGKQGFEVNIFDTYGDKIDEGIETVYEALINYNWRVNKKKTLLQKIFQMGSITGDCYVFLYPDTDKGFVEYSIIDSRNVIPLFKGGDHSNVIGYKVVKTLFSNDKEYIQKVTEYTVGIAKTYYVKETGKEADKFEVEEAVNDYNFIPLVHIENIAMSDSYGGKSDIEDIVKINKIFNEMAEDVKLIIDYYAQPTTVITGGTVGQLHRGLNQIWSGLPADATVSNLGLGEDLSASMNYLTLLKNAMHDLSGVPEEVLSKVQHISNTSASALQILYQPIIQVADKKAVSYGEGIEEINKLTCIIYAKNLREHPLFTKLPEAARGENAATFFERYKAEPQWKYNLPNDRLGMLNEAVIELSQKIGSRREIMERLGKKNIPKIIAEVKEDSNNEVAIAKAIKGSEKPNQGGTGTQ